MRATRRMRTLARERRASERGLTLPEPARAMALLAGALVAFMMLSVGGYVLARRLLGFAPGWVIELSGQMLLYIAFLTLPLVASQNGHIRIDLLLQRARGRLRGRLESLARAASAVACVLLTVYGLVAAIDAWQTRATVLGILATPKALLLLAIPLGASLTCKEYLLQLWRLASGQAAADADADEGAARPWSGG